LPRVRILWLVVALLLGGCGSTERYATLVLDFTPNAVHAGIYAALAHGDDRAQGVDLHVVAPSASTDSIKLLETGRANFAILDLHDLAIARQQGEPIMAIMAIVERPLAAVIAAPQIHDPRQLQGRTVGVTGVPSDTAVLRSIVAGSGGDPAAVRQLVIGYDAVPDLIAGRVAAVTSFWNDEGVTLQRRDPGVHIFRVDQFGAPSYPELVLCATSSSLRADPALARSVVRALVAGYRLALADPAAAAASLESRVAGLDPKLVSAELAVLRPAFAGPDGRVGELNLARLRSWATWETRFGIVRRVPDVATMFDLEFLSAAR
jgi:NitT/TauT family transport system substrate-binding protein/putative hydroxymethylpyrimidine transport system substrate-binding protein